MVWLVFVVDFSTEFLQIVEVTLFYSPSTIVELELRELPWQSQPRRRGRRRIS